MIRFAPGLALRLFRLAFCLVAVAFVASCGSGAVSGPPPVITPGPLAISPSSATLFSDLPTDFIVTGGNGTYIITSSNQSVIPISGTFPAGGGVLTVVPRQVAADTPVTLTVSDTGGTTPVTATLTVKPRTISNVVTVTPSASQSAACGTAVCAGGDAEVSVHLSQAGIPLTNRTVRFDVVSGAIDIIVSSDGSAELLARSATTTTDNTGTARMRIRVSPQATSQTALLQVTDTSSGFTQRTAITIAPGANAALNAQPATITFKGTTANTCASNISADVIVFGGRPPYQISQPGTFTVTPSVVAINGGRFTVTATGQCTAGSAIAVVDANGATVTVNAINTLSDVQAPTPQPTATFSVSPDTVTLNSCTETASVVLAGGAGQGSYFGASGNSSVTASVAFNGNTGVIRRASGSVGSPAQVTVAFSDGQTSKPVTVNIGLALQTATCP